MDVSLLLHVSLILLTALSALLVLWQWLAAFEFPLHRREAGKFRPNVTLLKPLKGADSETKACLRSWLEQEYASDVQVLFGVASAKDPVCEIVRDLLAEFPKANAQLVICEEQFGPNAKVSTLIHLERVAAHDIVIVSDADVRVPKDYLASAMQPLVDPKVGLVNSFYKFANPSTLAMHWEAVAVNADFWSQVLQSQKLKPIDFALGASMIIRRDVLKQTGGFERLVQYLADDYELGNGIAKAGKTIVISPVVVECWEAPKNFAQIWHHQLRWARTIRVCQPVPFFFSILSNATIWPIFWTIYLAFKTGFDPRLMFLPVLIFLPVRMFVALNLQEKLTGSLLHYRYFWLIPIKDILGAAIWLLSFLGNTVEWRGQVYRVQRGGKLEA